MATVALCTIAFCASSYSSRACWRFNRSCCSPCCLTASAPAPIPAPHAAPLLFCGGIREPADNPINALWAMRSSLDVVVSMRGVPTVFPRHQSCSQLERSRRNFHPFGHRTEVPPISAWRILSAENVWDGSRALAIQAQRARLVLSAAIAQQTEQAVGSGAHQAQKSAKCLCRSMAVFRCQPNWRRHLRMPYIFLICRDVGEVSLENQTP